MFIIFGWNHIKIKEYGVFDESFVCFNCHNQIKLRLIRIQKWFELFFIPVFPYSSKFFATCPICGLDYSAKISNDGLNKLTRELEIAEIEGKVKEQNEIRKSY